MTGREKLLEAAEDPKAVGEAIFTLPNGMPGFYIAGPDGYRFPDVPADLLKGAAMRNGLACARCHGNGLDTRFTDVVRSNLETSDLPEEKKARLRHLYPESLAKDAAADNDRFAAALTQLFGKMPARDPLALVEQQYRDRTAKRPPSADEVSIPPLDGLTQLDRRLAEPLKVDFTMINFQTKEKAFLFKPDDKMYLFVRNVDKKDLWIELVAVGRGGGMVELLAKQNPPLRLQPGSTYRFPADETKALPAGDKAGKNSFILYVSDGKFPAGTLMTPTAREPAEYVADRFVHAYPKTEAEFAAFAQIEKRTVTIETRAK